MFKCVKYPKLIDELRRIYKMNEISFGEFKKRFNGKKNIDNFFVWDYRYKQPGWVYDFDEDTIFVKYKNKSGDSKYSVRKIKDNEKLVI